MPRASLTNRVEALEQTVDNLAGLPERMDTLEHNLADFRNETQREFSAVRQDIRDGDEETRHQMRVLHEDLIERIKTIDEGIDALRRR